MKLSVNSRRLIRAALAEDVGKGDVTTKAVLGRSTRGRGVIVAGSAGVAAGVAVAGAVFQELDPRLTIRALKRDGQKVRPGDRVLEIRGALAPILTGERTALNFLQRLSGIATLASKFSKAVRGTRCRILDTRKTTPGLRELEKAAAQSGGAVNHRMRLDDLILIKDNHLAALGRNAIAKAVRRARARRPRMEIEVECDTLAQMKQALEAGARRILLDNMRPARLREAVRLARRSRRRVHLEASGGVRLGNVRRIARTGVDSISVGSITHSAPALDFSLQIDC